MRVIGRIFVILSAFLASSVIAGLIVGLGITGFRAGKMLLTEPIVSKTLLFPAWFVGSSVIGTAGFVLLILFVIPAELFRLRSIIIYTLGGLGAGLFTYYGRDYKLFFDNADPIVGGLVLAALAGLAFGFFYWLIAGRNAGHWRDERGQVQ